MGANEPLLDLLGQLLGRDGRAQDGPQAGGTAPVPAGQEAGRYRSLVEASAQIIWACDPAGFVTEDSPTWRAYTGQTYDQWCGYGYEACFHPEDRPQVMAGWMEGLRRGTRFSQEYRLRHHSGQWRWNRATAVPLAGADGRIQSWVGMNQDIHDQVSAQRMQTALFEISEAARGLDDLYARIHGIITEFMPARNFYVALAEPGGMVSFPYFVDEVDPPPPPLKLGHGLTDLVLASGRPWRLDNQGILDLVRDGRVVLRGKPPLDWLGVPLSMEGRTLGMLAVQSYSGDEHYTESDLELLKFVSGQIAACLDRKRAERERAQLEAELQHSLKLESLGRLAGGVAHDMNNVLGAIHAVTATLLAQHQDDPALASAMATIDRAALRGRDLVKGLTDFARKDLREARPVDLNRLAREEADLLNRTLLQKVAIDLDLAADLPPVLGEAGALAGALMNVCMNAVDAMPDGGTLRLATRVLDAGQVELDVADTGTGMAPDVLMRAMEPFFTTKPYGKGTGLGLSMVYSAVKAHGGTIHLESAPGQGTLVRMRLPAHDGTLAEPEEAPADGAAGAPLRVLLVDDDDLIREAAPEFLRLLGHQVETAASGTEALERLARDPAYDAVLLDVNMPGMDGFATLAGLRLDHPGLPVILASGFLGEEALERVAADPWAWTLGKPYTLEEARRVLEEAVSRSS